ncbi:MAG: MarR family winged helix-turn-helix transcriptional regulator [Actinomycetes bacterium]
MHGAGDLTPGQMAAWRRFLRAHSVVIRALEADLLAEQQLPLASYDVLVQLVEAPERRLRMTELAARVLLSRSGLTRLVDRLEREGLVRREACDSDARGLFAVLTDDGLARLRRATPTHLRGVRDYAVGRLDDDDLAVLDRILARMLGEQPPEAPVADEQAVTAAG